MQRWFFAQEAEPCESMAAPSSTTSSVSVQSAPTPIAYRSWQFCVVMPDKLLCNEHMAVVGNCEGLGDWQLGKCLVMTRTGEQTPEKGAVWSTEATIFADRPTEYRYLVCAIDPSTEKLIVRRWETHLKPRVVSPEMLAPPKADCRLLDMFGDNYCEHKVDRGWLSSETIVQLKFFGAPFTSKTRLKRRLIHVKVTPMYLKIPSACDPTALVGSSASGSHLTLEDSLSNDTHDTHDTRENGADPLTTFAFNEVTTLRSGASTISAQPQFGTPCGPNDLVIFHLTVGDFDSTAYLIDLFAWDPRAEETDMPHHLGYHYVLPNLLKHTEGSLEVPITCATRHRPLGMMHVGYLVVRPTPSLPLDMRVSYTRYWNGKWRGLDVGHRGSGTSFKALDSVIRENTITSLKNAVDHGADMVEFDVQLSKDLVPVVYHDFMVYVLLKSKHQEDGMMSLPMRELTLDQLKNLKVYHTAEGQARASRCFENDDQLEHQPFPTLAEVLDAIDPHVGFNIEIKWSQRLQDGTMEEHFEHVVDRNLYLDCILDVVMRKAGERRIVFSCFDPDICTMLRFKQNRYPVMFLTIGVTTKYKNYLDPRGKTIENATYNSLAMELLGIVAHTEDLLRDPTQVYLTFNVGLVLFCWGEDNNDKETIKQLKKWGLHAIIYDKMDVLTTKEIKQSVFLLQATRSQKELFKLQALEMGNKWHPTAAGASPAPAK